MAKTYEITVATSGWTQLSNGEPNVLVQTRVGNIEVAVSDVTPTVVNGHNLDNEEPSISFGSLGASDKVWARSSQAVKVIVTK